MHRPTGGGKHTLSEEKDARIAELQKAYDALTGETFSDRVHSVLRQRTEEAEALVEKRNGQLAAMQEAMNKAEANAEELAHVKRKLAGLRGEEETSQTLAIYWRRWESC